MPLTTLDLVWDVGSVHSAQWTLDEGMAPGGLPPAFSRGDVPLPPTESFLLPTHRPLWGCSCEGLCFWGERSGEMDHSPSVLGQALVAGTSPSVCELPLCCPAPASSPSHSLPARKQRVGSPPFPLPPSPVFPAWQGPSEATCLVSKPHFKVAHKGALLGDLQTLRFWNDTPSPFISVGTSPATLSLKQNSISNPGFGYLALLLMCPKIIRIQSI